MATITSNGTGGGNWATGATWVGGVKPGNTDSVVLAASDVVTYDEDMSGWANGIAGLTLGANSALVASTSPGNYYLKMAGNITATGVGAELRAGTAETAYPSDCTFKILMNGNYQIQGHANNYLTCKFYCYEPVVRFVKLISATPKAITGISKANPCTITCVGHGYSGGDSICLVNIGGMVELDSMCVKVKTVLDGDHFTIADYSASTVEIDSTLYTTYTSGGYACPQIAEAVASTALEVDVDVSSDPEWTRSGASVKVCNTARAVQVEEFTISSISGSTINISSGLANTKQSGSFVVLIDRNIEIIAAGSIASLSSVYYGTGHVLNCAFRRPGSIGMTATSYVSGVSFDGVISNFSYGLGTASSGILGGIFCGNTYNISGARNFDFTGKIIGCSYGMTGCYEFKASGLISGSNYGINGCRTWVCDGTIENGSTAISENRGGKVSGLIKGNTSGIYASNVTLLGATFVNNQRDLYFPQYGFAINTLFSSATEFYVYSEYYLRNYNNFQSFDHDQIAGAFRAWTRGGITSSNTSEKPTGRTRSYQSVCESATYPCWHQREILVEAGRQVRIRVWGKADAGVTYKAQLVLPTDDPLVTGSGSGEWEQTMTADGSWYEYKTAWTNTATYPVTIYLRFLATAASGNAYCDFQWAFDRSPSRR